MEYTYRYAKVGRLSLPEEPIKPAEPSKYHLVKKRLFSFKDGSAITLDLILSKINEYPKQISCSDIFLEANPDDDFNTGIAIYFFEKIENPRYDAEYEEYLVKLKKYEIDIAEYKLKLEMQRQEDKADKIKWLEKELERVKNL